MPNARANPTKNNTINANSSLIPQPFQLLSNDHPTAAFDVAWDQSVVSLDVLPALMQYAGAPSS
jgi:hypothetical protein